MAFQIRKIESFLKGIKGLYISLIVTLNQLNCVVFHANRNKTLRYLVSGTFEIEKNLKSETNYF